MPLVYHKYRHLSRGILIKIRRNNQIFKDQCQDFRERAASRQAAVLSASLPHYTLYRLFVKPSCTLIRNYLEVFPIVVSRYQQRTYGAGGRPRRPNPLRAKDLGKTKKRGGGLHYIGVLSDTGSESTFTTYPASSQQHNNVRLSSPN